MLEKMKTWNWKLIISIFLTLVLFFVFTALTNSLNAEEFAPYMADGYEPTPECIYGFVVCLSAVVFGFFLVQFWKTSELLFPLKKRRKK